jgi:hypothetical protein
MTQFHDRQTMERLHQHLARADLELRDAQHFLAPDSAEEAEMEIVHAVSEARLGVTSALERVRARLGDPGPSDAPTEESGGPETLVEHPEGEEVWLDAEGREAQPQEPSETPSEATEQPGRVGPQTPLEGARGEDSSPFEPRESSEMHMPEAGGGPLPHDQQRASKRPWWQRIFGG